MQSTFLAVGFYDLTENVFFLAVTNGSSHSPTALNGAPSPPNGYSNGPSSSSSSSLANQQLPPACGARQLSKLKRFLTTLQQFGNDISPEIGERVRTLVLGLVVSVGEVSRAGQSSFTSWKCSPLPLTTTKGFQTYTISLENLGFAFLIRLCHQSELASS